MAAKRKKRAKARAKGKRKRKHPTGAKTPGCVLPTRPNDESLRAVMFHRAPHKERDVIEYVEWQLGKKRPVKVRHLERLKVETVHGKERELWDVHTTDGRWWVVTEPMNVYPQDAFPSADYMLSFHIGLAARMSHKVQQTAPERDFVKRFADAFRRWEQAAIAMDTAKEAEDFQGVGMKCRECLVTLARDAQAGVVAPEGTERPKGADFKAWVVLIAKWALPGDSAENIRSHLIDVSLSTWKLANWLTHTTSARKSDAELVLSAVTHLLDAFASSIVRKEAGPPDKCPHCSSQQIQSVYAPELEREPPYVLLCEACGWNDTDDEGPDGVKLQ